MPLRTRGIRHHIMDTAVHGWTTVLGNTNGDPGGGCTRVAGAIRHLKGDGVDATVATDTALCSQLYGLAIARYDDVIGGVAIAVAVFNFIARDVIDHNAVEVHSAVATAGTNNQVGDIYRMVNMVWWPQRDVVSI